MKLSKLIGKWIHDSKPLYDHFTVVPATASRTTQINGAWVVPAKVMAEGWITYICANTSAFRQGSGVDRLVHIYETHVEDSGTKIEAADPQLFAKLEQILRRKHDRTGEYNIVTFRDDCPVKLRDCGCVKAFCGH